MPDLTAELGSFAKEYERANNSHDIDRVLPHIADDATYWFSDGSFRGLEEIKGAIERTFAAIQDEEYEIHDLEWVVVTDAVAVCRYRFRWNGVVEGVASRVEVGAPTSSCAAAAVGRCCTST